MPCLRGRTRRTLSVASAMLLTLAACGGGGGGGGGGAGGGEGLPPGTGNGGASLVVDGIYATSSVGGAPVYNVTYSLLPSGEYYAYVVQNGNPYGLAHGTATGTASAIQSGNLSFYNFQGFNGGTLTSGGTLSATFNATGASNFTATVTSTTAVTQATQQARYASQDNRLLYSQPLSLGQLAGTYRGAVYSVGLSLNFGTPVGAFTMDGNGGFSITVGSCLGTGTVLPLTPGKGIFRATVGFSGTGCGLAGQSGSGILTPTAAVVDASGRAGSVGMLLQILSASGGSAFVLSLSR